MQSMAQELAPEKIRVNAIAPGAIRTPINRSARDSEEERRRLRQLLRQQKSLSDQKWHTADDIRLKRQRSVKTSMQNGVHRIPSWRNFLRTC